ncbi:MAG: hypothetical protein ACRD16_08540 [Thermoanaerobaculia bacterium]
MKRLEYKTLKRILTQYWLGQMSATLPGILEKGGVFEILAREGVERPREIPLVPDGAFLREHFVEFADQFREIGLNVTAEIFQEAAEAVGKDKIDKRSQDQIIQDVARSLERELKSIFLMVVPPDKMLYLRGPFPFGEAVAKRFSGTSDDIAEACRCLAFGLNTAAVFHLMRVVEVGLVALRSAIGKSDFQPSWDAVFRDIDRELGRLNGTTKDDGARARLRFISEARIHIEAIKNVWRNPTIHSIATLYDDRQAGRVFEAVRDLMEQLARGLPEDADSRPLTNPQI